MTYFLDLFAGIGGFALGATWAGLHFGAHYFSEVDDYAVRNYQRRFPDAIPLGDIRGIRAADLPAGDWIIAGGFPCQDISLAGKGAGLEGARSGLWYEYARLIGELRPRYAIMENVGALVSRGLDRVLGSLAALGYDAEWQDIRASDVGAPHRRERIWIVAYPSSRNAGSGAGKREGSESFDREPSFVLPNTSGRSGETKAGDHNETGISYSKSNGRGPGRTRGLDSGGERESEQSLQDVADADQIERNGCGGARNGRAKPTDGGGEMADANSEQMGRATKSRSQCNWWATEPDVGRSFNGIPKWLDRYIGIGCSYAENQRRVEALRKLWSDHVSQTLRRAIGGLERLQQADLLFSFLCQYESESDEARLLVEGEEVSEGFLRGLRREALFARSSHRSEQEKQYFGEYSDPLQVVPQFLAFDSPPHWAGDGWEDATHRVTKGIPARVDRLSCLGNSIVPQIAELIFSQAAFDEWRVV